MSVSIRQVRSASPHEWDETWEACGYATYFHSREWAELWRRHSGGRLRPAPLRFEFSDGRNAVLPLSARVGRLGLVHGWESSPAGTYGGWISADALTAGHVAETVERLGRECPDLTWRVNPFFEPRDYVSGVAGTADTTHVLDLAQGYEAIAASWKAGGGSTARKIRKAERSGVSVRPAASEADWSDYVACYEASLARWGETVSSRYEPEFFEILRLMASPHVRLWLATVEGEVAAGALCFRARDHVVYWHGASREEHFDKRPVNLLMAEIIRHACTAGLRWFDFNPSGGHEGVAAFKASFGAAPLACPLVERRSSGPRALRILKMAGRSFR